MFIFSSMYNIVTSVTRYFIYNHIKLIIFHLFQYLKSVFYLL